MVHKSAQRLVDAILSRGVEAVREAEATPWVLDHLVADRLLSDEALADVGVLISNEGGQS
jgi:hypothetical protein